MFRRCVAFGPRCVSSCGKRVPGLRPSLYAMSQLSFHTSQIMFNHGFGRSSSHERKKSFSEKQEGRVRKSREERRSKEEQFEEARNYVGTELPDVLTKEYETICRTFEEKCMRLTDMPSALERVKVDVAGKERPLSQCGTFSKPKPNELIFTPNLPNIINSVLLRVSKFDSELCTNKTDDGKVRIGIPRQTRSRRERIAEEILSTESASLHNFKNVRKIALQTLKNICPEIDHENEAILQQEIDAVIRETEAKLKEKAVEMSQEALTAKVEEMTENTD
eukprot:PhF_6_TR6837/c0_g1_i1/m.9847/K02838/frr, MRRF, RRF; ribosome recycling factor